MSGKLDERRRMKKKKIFLGWESAPVVVVWTVICLLFIAVGLAFRKLYTASIGGAMFAAGIVLFFFDPSFCYILFSEAGIEIKKFGKVLKKIPRGEVNVALCMKTQRGKSVPALAFSSFPYYESLFTSLVGENEDCYVMILSRERLRIVYENLNKRIRTDGVREESFKESVWKSALKNCMYYAELIDGYNENYPK